jgi:hypothetical protein
VRASRLFLPTRRGGVGVQSVRHCTAPAFLSSILLVGPTVHRNTSPNLATLATPESITATIDSIPGFAQAYDKCVLVDKQLNPTTENQIFNHLPMKTFLTAGARSSDRKDFNKRLADASASLRATSVRAALGKSLERNLYEGGYFSRTWISTPDYTCRHLDEVFATSLAIDLGLPLIGSVSRAKCGATVTPVGFYRHCHTCGQCRASLRVRIHNAIRDRLFVLFRKAANASADNAGSTVTIAKEKLLKDCCTYKPTTAPVTNEQDSINMRADLFATFDTGTHASVAFDIVTVCPALLANHASDVEDAGKAAQRSSKYKTSKYSQRWEVNDNSLKIIPISVELSGYLDIGNKSAIKKFFALLYPAPSKTPSEYTRKTLQTISHSLHWTQGKVMAEYRNATFPLPPGSLPEMPSLATQDAFLDLEEAGQLDLAGAPQPHGADGTAHGAVAGV